MTGPKNLTEESNHNRKSGRDVLTGNKSTVTGVAMNNTQLWHTQTPPEGSMIRCAGYDRRLIDWSCYLNELKYGHIGPMPEVGWVPKGD
jgi:hypothetical protein